MKFYSGLIKKFTGILLKTGIIYLVMICNPVIAQQNENNNDGFNTFIKWDFDKRGDTLGWSIPRPMMGVVNGGALWVKCFSSLLSGQDYYYPYTHFTQNRNPNIITSPKNIGIKAANAKKLRMRVLNLSSETNGRLSWISTDDLNKDIGPVGFSMEPYSKKWQEIVCNLDEIPWSGELYQLKLVMGLQGVRGDIYIDWVALTDGQPRIKPDKPDLNSEEKIPRISVPGITQSDFNEAFNVLNDAMVYDNLPDGMVFPFISPGGYWGNYWWLLDATLTIPALKWVNLNFCENMIRGFINVQSQNPDGRIDHEGKDVSRGGPDDCSVLPDCYFVGAYDVFKCTNNSQLKEEIYNSLSSYMGWWLSPFKRDKESGLFMGQLEETFGFIKGGYTPQTVAQVDLNASICLGSYILADISRRSGCTSDFIKYKSLAEDIGLSVNKFLWNDNMGAFLNYNLIEKKHLPGLWVHTFNPFVKNIATPDKQTILLKKLVDPTLFNWGKIPLTSLAKTDSNYTVRLGHYNGDAWSGDIWTLRNMFIIKGLKDIGKHDLASELNWKTIRIFNANYKEFLEPDNGVGQGAQGYSWTAAQYIEAIIQNLFGIDYDHMLHRLTIYPHIPNQLKDKELSISNLMLPGSNTNKLSLTMKETAKKTEIEIEVSGKIENDTLTILIPYEGLNQKINVQDKITNKNIPVFIPEEMKNTIGARINLLNNNIILISKQ